MKLIYLMLSLILLTACKNQNETTEDEPMLEETTEGLESIKTPSALGVYTYKEVTDIEESSIRLKHIFNANENTVVLTEIDHSEHAKTIGESLYYTNAIFFGNPNLGTALMQINPLTGLDLPQKIIFLKTKTGNQISYNDVEYLNQRYGLNNHENLSVISNTLKTVTEQSSGSTTTENFDIEISKHQGIITKKSAYKFDETLDKLTTVFNEHENIDLMASLDHQANAKKVGLEMLPCYLFIFGNPTTGVPLIKAKSSIALDLPHKMLVWEDKNGEVFVSYNDIYFIGERHQLEGQKDILKKVDATLNDLSAEVIK